MSFLSATWSSEATVPHDQRIITPTALRAHVAADTRGKDRVLLLLAPSSSDTTVPHEQRMNPAATETTRDLQ